MIQGVVTALLLVAFVGGSLWLFSDRRKAAFDAAARLPLEDDPPGRSRNLPGEDRP